MWTKIVIEIVFVCHCFENKIIQCELENILLVIRERESSDLFQDYNNHLLPFSHGVFIQTMVKTSNVFIVEKKFALLVLRNRRRRLLNFKRRIFRFHKSILDKQTMNEQLLKAQNFEKDFEFQ